MLPRNRTLTGCGTCRSRHVKCDEARPACENCHQQGLACLGYERQLIWAGGRDGDRLYRRPLFSEAAQESMTRVTADGLGKQSPSAALAQIEIETSTSLSSAGGLFKGPFGVLALDDNQDEPESDPSMDWDLLWPAIAGDTPIFDLPLLDPFLELDTLPSHPQSLLPSIPLSLTPLPPLEVSESTNIPRQTADLLRYFKENVISLSFPLKNCRECPWQTVHLPAAMSAFAELTIHHSTTQTRLSLLYSLLAASCLHKYARSQYADGMDISAKQFKEIAKQHLEIALDKEVRGPNRAKYKEILMAVLSMVMLSIFNGENSSAQAFLVDAEYLIRTRGLPKPHKSLKVRSLHHVYTFLRIMAESTCGCALLDICLDRPSASLLSMEPSSDSLRSFRLANDILDADLDMTIAKGNRVGCNDIHLEVMGQWDDTLFPDIYGIPESLIALLSQVIRLANEQELLHRGDPAVSARIAGDLKRRARVLEQYILSWDQSPDLTTTKNSQSTTVTQNLTAAHFMAKAMQQALVLFYYRRVPNISALILQDNVRSCLEFLGRYDEARVQESETAPCHNVDPAILWPGFVAACEALGPDLQSGLQDWLIATGHRTSLGPFSAAVGTAQCVWKARSETKDYTLSWFDVLKHERCPIIAT
ncbi:fungal-specific transcription factor domain-containing protein [Aspergillus karnatakaensis]|uniref:Zn(II)2Cys6 transcription factor n=1 Tax=Aspergillus karnatakaensis TaxID=1810916 RepID=UPI003CCD636C